MKSEGASAEGSLLLVAYLEAHPEIRIRVQLVHLGSEGTLGREGQREAVARSYYYYFLAYMLLART